MNIKTNIAVLVASSMLIAAPVFAETTDLNAGLGLNASTAGGVRADAKAELQGSLTIDKAKTRANQEIDRRVAALTQLSTKIQGMARVTDAYKTSIAASIQAQITELTTLKAKIAADTDLTVLKTDVQSITKSYRIFALIIPQGAIAATADKINATADLMTTFGTKLTARITEAKTAGKDTAALETASTDFTAKLADAKVQTAAAITLSSGLKPDNGDQTTMDANKKALTDARAKIQAARKDLQAARADAVTIVKGLASFKLNATTSTSTTTTQ